MTTKGYCLMSSLVFTIVALGHAWRALRGTEILIAGSAVPMGVSWLFAAVAGGLALWGFRLAAKAG